jgi:hypothetical protein
VVEPNSTLSEKLTFGKDFIINQRQAEKTNVNINDKHTL